MTTISKGGNVALPDSATIRAGVSWDQRPGTPRIDVSALLLAADGKVRGTDDFVFFNQPEHPSGAVVDRGDAIEIAPARIEAAVEKVAVVASVDDGTFGSVGRLRLTLSDAAGAEIVVFDVQDATRETAFVFGEVYRRNGGWKFRAVGQGYDAGLAGLAADFGVEIDEPAADPEPAATYPAYQPPAVPEPDPAPTYPAYQPPAPAPAPARASRRTPPVLFEWNTGGDLVADGAVIASASRSWWRERAELVIGGEEHVFRSSWGTLLAESRDGREVCSAQRTGLFSQENWDITGTAGSYGFANGGFFTSRMLVQRNGREVGEILPDRWLTDRPQMRLDVDIPDVDAAFLLWVAYVVRARESRN